MPEAGEIHFLSPSNGPLIVVKSDAACSEPTLLEVEGAEWRVRADLASRLPELGFVDATNEKSPWFAFRYGYGHAVGSELRPHERSAPGSGAEAPQRQLARIVRRPLALMGEWPNDAWLIVNENLERSLSYICRSLVYRIREQRTELVFAESEVAHFIEGWAAVPHGIVAQEYLLTPKETLRISLFTDQGRKTWFAGPAIFPRTFGAVRDQIVLAVWTDSDRIRLTQWSPRGERHERSFSGISCGPTMFLSDRGLSVPPCALLELGNQNAWRLVTAPADTASAEAALVEELEKRNLSDHSEIWYAAGAYWFSVHSEGRQWLVTNHAMNSKWEVNQGTCAERARSDPRQGEP